MNTDSWTCLLVENGTGVIDNRVRNALKCAACELYLRKWEKMHILNDVIDGIITTVWSTHLVGTRSGVLFRTEFDSEGTQNYKVNFLMSEEDLGRGADLLKQFEETPGGWESTPVRVPVEALYQFNDLRPSRKQYN